MMPPPVPVVLISEMFPPKVGTAVLYDNLYRRLGLPVTVVTEPLAGQPPGYAYVHATIGSTLRGVREPGALSQHIRLARALRRLRPAVVHCGRLLPEGIPAMLAAATARLPFMPWVHGEEINSALQSREHTLLLRLVLRRARLLVASSGNGRAVLETLGVHRDKVRVVYPGVEAFRFATARPIRRADGPIILTVGRLQRRKGHDLILQALPDVLRRHPSLHHVIVGEGEERPRLEALARELGIAASVTFVGEVPQNELPGYFAGCDVFVMPNRVDNGDFEGFGIVFLEAAAAGRPVIGGRSGGVPEAVEEGQTGLLVGGTDAAELARGLDVLLSDEQRRRRMGEAGRLRVEQRFTWEASAAGLRAAHLEAAGAQV